MNLSFDHSQYTELGVGDRVEAGHYKVVLTDFDPETQSGSCRVVAVTNADIGTIIFDSTEITYLRKIDPIAKTQFASGATRSDATGRGRFDLIPYEAMLALARRYEMGAERFGDRNWERGQPLSRLLSSMRRHAHQVGYDYSEDHIGAVLWNAAAFVTMVARMEAGILPRELDDIGYFLNREATK